MRRTRPWVSSDCRSVRTVTVDTPKRAARSPTRTNPCSSTSAVMRSCRTSAGAVASELIARLWHLELGDLEEPVARVRERARQLQAQARRADGVEANGR